MSQCRHCQGSGRIAVELGSSQAYRCTDCNGHGEMSRCDKCGDPKTQEDVCLSRGRIVCIDCIEQEDAAEAAADEPPPADVWQHRPKVGEDIWNLMTR